MAEVGTYFVCDFILLYKGGKEEQSALLSVYTISNSWYADEGDAKKLGKVIESAPTLSTPLHIAVFQFKSLVQCNVGLNPGSTDQELGVIPLHYAVV